MEALANLIHGFNIAISPFNLMIAAFGIFLGVIIGVIPGLGGTSGVAILLPLTFTMSTTSAIVFLSCIYWGALFGGAITSILFAPPLAEVALKFGPAENFAVLTLALSTFTGLGGGSAAKTIGSACVGFLLASVGLDIVTGRPRLNFGSITLLSGFSFITASIGLFGVGEILLAAEEALEFKGVQGRIGLKDIWVTIKTLWRNLFTWITGTILGFWIGVMPGTGANPASFMSYGIAKQYSKHPEKFGTGVPEGVIATESAAHAAGIGALLPLITLGIPGSPTAAVILGGLYIWGLQPGPMLFVEQKDFVWGFIASMYIGNVMGVLFCLLMLPVFAAILKTPYAILTPLIILLSAIGAYAVKNTMLDVWLLLFYGLIGYAFKKLKYPLAPLVIALVLGDMAEEALRQSLILSGGSLTFFFTRPIAAGFLILTIFLFLLPAIRPVAARVRRTFKVAEVEQAGGD